MNLLDNGKLDGPAIYYYPEGRVRTIGQFKNGKWWGKWKDYDKAGDLIEFKYYDQEGNFDRREKIKN